MIVRVFHVDIAYVYNYTKIDYIDLLKVNIILAAREMLLLGEMRIQYMHMEMHWYIRNILALFNEKIFFSNYIHYIDIFYCSSVCHPMDSITADKAALQLL